MTAMRLMVFATAWASVAAITATTQAQTNNNPPARIVISQPDVPYLPKPASRPADWLVEHDPVTPGTSPEATALLKFLYSISLQHTLTGQHNYNANQGQYTVDALRRTGKTPAIYGTDWGTDKGEYNNRENVVQSIIKEYKKGSIICLCWHEVRPTDNEPATFRQSVQGKLTNEQFNNVITPGTDLNLKWCAQVDVIAGYMKELRDAHVPILWRPYHEMNGDWFWWGGRRGQRGTMQMYRMIYDRLVNFHHLNNLIWVWNVDRPETKDRQFVDYFPGQQYVDVLAFDDYIQWKQSYYDDLNALSDGKVMAVAECGANVPPLDAYKTQPKWSYYMIWAGFLGRRQGGRAGQPAQAPINMRDYVKDPRMLSLEDPQYWQAISPLRAVSGLPTTPPPPPSVPTTQVGGQ